MKIFLSEYRHDYTTYTFGYTTYAVYESKEDVVPLYEAGFLPYTGNVNLHTDLYYKSRGIRIDLTRFKDSSENRRVDRKALSLKLNFEIIPISEFNEWTVFFDFAHQYSSQRIGDAKMPEERLEYITQRKYLSHIIKFTTYDHIAGYVLAVMSDTVFHYWFSFYDTKYLEQNIPIGKWMMWKGIRIAKELGCSHAYLGNSYLETSLYKSRDFIAVEFYDGNGWSVDLKDLHIRCKNDKELKELDSFKQGNEQDSWIAKFYKTVK